MARRLVLPTQGFFHTEGPGGVLLLACSVAALALANSYCGPEFAHLLETPFALALGPWALWGNLRECINDGLMPLFFYVVGLEIKRELLEGRLASPRKAALPVVAPLGGMVVPALIYSACNLGGGEARGWGIPMATDIAFSVGILILLGDRVPASARIFLLALAIADDQGAFLVIALFSWSGISWPAPGLAGGLLMAIVAMTRTVSGLQASTWSPAWHSGGRCSARASTRPRPG